MSRWARAGLPILLFAVVFISRAYRPLPLPTMWFTRVEAFDVALDDHDWMATYQSPHPGFTTMVIGGLALRLYHVLENSPGEMLFNWAFPPYASEYIRQLTVGVMGLAAALAGLIVSIALVLRRLGGWMLALTVSGLMIFEPFYLAESRVLHVDALVSTLMLLSVLLLLVSLETGQHCCLMLSGLAGGMAFLSKTPSLFLAPFVGLALFVRLVTKLRADPRPYYAGWKGGLLQETWRTLAWPSLLWVMMALLPFALWPAIWVRPLLVLQSMFGGTKYYALHAHPYTRFFAGQQYYGIRPSFLFLPTTVAFKSTFLTLTLGIAALGHYTLWRKRVEQPMQPTSFRLLIAYAVLFSLQMMIAAKQTPRYILPVQLVLDVFAGVGIVGLSKTMQRAATRYHLWGAAKLGPVVLTLVVLGLQMAVAFAYAPYYGTHHNHLLGGNRTAVNVVEIMRHDDGMMYVADYLRHQPEAETLRVGTASWTTFISLKLHSIPGQVLDDVPNDADYYLFDVESIQRGFDTERGEAIWESYRVRPPQLVVTFDGVEYLWLYTTQSVEPPERIVIQRAKPGLAWLTWTWTTMLIISLGIVTRFNEPKLKTSQND